MVNKSQKEELAKKHYVVVDIMSGDESGGESAEGFDDDNDSSASSGLTDAEDTETQLSGSSEKKKIADEFKQMNAAGLFNIN